MPSTAEATWPLAHQCRAEYQSLQLVLNTVDSAPAPDRPADYGARVWGRLAPNRKAARLVRRLVCNVATALVGSGSHCGFAARRAFLLADFRSRGPTAGAGIRRARFARRILLVAVGDHLDRSQMVLAELTNSPDGKGQVDISEEREQAEQLLEDNRLYRQTARTAGDNGVAVVLDDLERVLLEIARSPSTLSNRQLEQLQREIADRGLLFKVRVMGSRSPSTGGHSQ